jgi:hypothetical protein
MKNVLMPLKYVSRKYKIPADWLETEARYGGLSCLLANSQILFDEKLLLRELAGKVGKPKTSQRPTLLGARVIQ